MFIKRLIKGFDDGRTEEHTYLRTMLVVKLLSQLKSNFKCFRVSKD